MRSAARRRKRLRWRRWEGGRAQPVPAGPVCADGQQLCRAGKPLTLCRGLLPRPETMQLVKEIEKLRYQVKHLKRSLLATEPSRAVAPVS